MKKILIMAATIMMAACSQPKPKVLILYYSQNSNTKTVAEEIQGRLDADIEEIVSINPYDGNFQETIDRCLKEKQEGILPAIKPLTADLKEYDVVFLGFPVWFGTYAPPVATLLTSVDLAGKMVVPFCTFGSGGLDSSVRDLEAAQPDAKILPGYGVRTARLAAVPAEVERWLKENGFISGKYVKYDDFSAVRPASPEEAAIFDAAVAGYPMLHAAAKNISSRSVEGGIEYLFEAEDAPNPAFGDEPHMIKVYVLALEDKAPEFTQVLR